MNRVSLSIIVVVIGLLVVSRAEAQTVIGNISFSGNLTAYATPDGTGAPITNFMQAQSIVFGQTYAGGGQNRSFTAVSANSVVNMTTNPLILNPLTIPNTPLWTVTNYSFRLTSLSIVFVNSGGLVLYGNGVFSDGNPVDSSIGTWVGQFTTDGTGDFHWSSSCSASDPVPSLQFALVGNKARLSWPTNSLGAAFSVQMLTNWAEQNWVELTNTPTLVSNQWVMTNGLCAGSTWFRLKH